MILGDFKRLLSQLDNFPNDAEVVFTPYEACCGGYPEWENVSFYLRDDTGVVEIMLREERPE